MNFPSKATITNAEPPVQNKNTKTWSLSKWTYLCGGLGDLPHSTSHGGVSQVECFMHRLGAFAFFADLFKKAMRVLCFRWVFTTPQSDARDLSKSTDRVRHVVLSGLEKQIPAIAPLLIDRPSADVKLAKVLGSSTVHARRNVKQK